MNGATAMLTAELVREMLSYNPDTGCFRSMARNRKVGSTDKDGYLVIMISKKTYKAHRLAWLYVNGSWPTAQIDHINGVKNDNRISNLREATNAQNAVNTGVIKTNTSGLKGVSYSAKRRKYRAQIMRSGRNQTVGFFDSAHEAHAAYAKAATEYFGEFARLK